MDSRRIALLTVAIVAIGIFALPGTVSLLSGQHTWYDLSGGKNEVPCEKCHAEIADEMGSDDNGVHRNLTCALCHRTPFKSIYDPSSGHYEPESGRTYASGMGSGSTPGIEAHAASTVECMDCHGIKYDSGRWGPHYYTDECPEYEGWEETCVRCHGNNVWILDAGGFGLIDIIDDTGDKAAHKQFVLDAINDTLMEGANEACIACHTRVGVNITWTKNTVLEFTAVEDDLGNWTLTDFKATGDNVTKTSYKNNWTNSY